MRINGYLITLIIMIACVMAIAENSPILNQRLMEFNESTPNVTFNSLTWLVDGLVFPHALIYPATSDPSVYSATDGDIYIVPVSATGAWISKDNEIAQYQNGGWSFISPATGWVVDAPINNINNTWREGKIFYTGAAWETIADATTQSVSIIADVTTTQKRFYDITYSAGFVVQVSGPGAWMEK